MPKFAANLAMMFNEYDYPHRFAAAAAAGFRGVESLYPYTESIENTQTWLSDNALELVLINMPAGDWTKGERGLTCLPGRQSEYRDSIAKAIEYALALGCRNIHSVAGLAPEPGPERMPYENTFRENLAWAAEQMAPLELNLMIEPINGKRDVPGMFLQTTSQAREIIAEICKPNLRLQFDVYHVQIMDGDVIRRIGQLKDAIAHVHTAGNPGRGELDDRQEINYPPIMQALLAAGYKGYVGQEFIPTGDPWKGLQQAVTACDV